MRSTRYFLAFPSVSVLACADAADTSRPSNQSPAIISVLVEPSTATFVSHTDTLRLTVTARDAIGNAVSNPKLT